MGLFRCGILLSLVCITRVACQPYATSSSSRHSSSSSFSSSSSTSAAAAVGASEQRQKSELLARIDRWFNCVDVDGAVEPLLGFNQTCHDYITGTVEDFTARAKLLCCFNPSALPCCSPYARRLDLDEKCCSTCDLAKIIWLKQAEILGDRFVDFKDDPVYCKAVRIGECWSLSTASRCPVTCGLTAKCFPHWLK